MTQESPALRGIAVNTSFYSGEEPTITHGSIEVENQSMDTFHFSIRNVRCLAKDEKITIDSFFVYRLPDYEEEDPKDIRQPSQTTIQYEISFAPIPARAFLTDEIQIEVELEVNSEVSYLYSPYYITRRVEKRT